MHNRIANDNTRKLVIVIISDYFLTQRRLPLNLFSILTSPQHLTPTLENIPLISGWQPNLSACSFPFSTHWLLFLLQIPKSVHSPKLYCLFFTLLSWKCNPLDNYRLTSKDFKIYYSSPVYPSPRPKTHTNFNFSLDIFTWDFPPSSQTLWGCILFFFPSLTVLYGKSQTHQNRQLYIESSCTHQPVLTIVSSWPILFSLSILPSCIILSCKLFF